MKRKYKIQILIIVIVVSFVWGLTGSWLYIRIMNESLTGFALLLGGQFVLLLIPIRIVASKVRKDI